MQVGGVCGGGCFAVGYFPTNAKVLEGHDGTEGREERRGKREKGGQKKFRVALTAVFSHVKAGATRGQALPTRPSLAESSAALEGFKGGRDEGGMEGLPACAEGWERGREEEGLPASACCLHHQPLQSASPRPPRLASPGTPPVPPLPLNFSPFLLPLLTFSVSLTSCSSYFPLSRFVSSLSSLSLFFYFSSLLSLDINPSIS